MYCLVGHGHADLMSEAELTSYPMQLHNDPISHRRKALVRHDSLPEEKLVESFQPSLTFLRLNIQSELKGVQSQEEESIKFPTQRNSIYLTPDALTDVDLSTTSTEEMKESTSPAVQKASMMFKSRSNILKKRESGKIDTPNMFKNEFLLDPHLDRSALKNPYIRLVNGLTQLGHEPYIGDCTDDHAHSVYYAPHTSFVNKSHTRMLFRTYEYDGIQSSEFVSLFRSIDRERLMLSLMERHFNIHWIKKTVLKDMSWLHRESLKTLEENISSSNMMKKQSTKKMIQRIRNYFGEQIALNYALSWSMGHGMMVPGFVGFTIWMILFATANATLHRWLRVAYTLFVMLWMRYFINEWRRENNELNLLWGKNEESEEKLLDSARVEFKGVKLPDPVTDQMRRQRDESWTQKIAYVISWSATFLMGGISLGCFALVLYFREHLLHCVIRPDTELLKLFVRGISSVLFGIQIILSEVVFKRIALILTECENHRRTGSHRAHFVAKAYIFSLINNFSSALYIVHFDTEDIFRLKETTCFDDNSISPSSFVNISTEIPQRNIASEMDDPNPPLYSSLLGAKSLNLLFLFLSQIVLGDLIEFFLPKIQRCCVRDKPCHFLQSAMCCCLGKSSSSESSQANESSSESSSKSLSEKNNAASASTETNEIFEETASNNLGLGKLRTRTKKGPRSIKSIFAPLVNQTYSMEFDFIEEYDNLSDIIVCFTFATAFAASFPLGSAIAVVAFYIQFRLGKSWVINIFAAHVCLLLRKICF